MKFDNVLLQLLANLGDDAKDDYDDGIGGYFGWALFYQDGSLRLRVTLEEPPPPNVEEGDFTVTEQTWILTPQS